jgi:hypothetical protein
VEVGLASLRGDGDYVAAFVVAVAVVDDGDGVAAQRLVVEDDGWVEQDGPSVGILQLFNSLVHRH